MLKGLRRSLWPALDSTLGRIGAYAVSTVTEEGYVGTLDMSIEATERILEDLGFSFSVVAALKDRRCPDADKVEAGSWIRRDGGRFADHQLHVHVFEGPDGTTDIYAHHEANWITPPVDHYLQRDCDEARGVEMTRRILDD